MSLNDVGSQAIYGLLQNIHRTTIVGRPLLNNVQVNARAQNLLGEFILLQLCRRYEFRVPLKSQQRDFDDRTGLKLLRDSAKLQKIFSRAGYRAGFDNSKQTKSRPRRFGRGERSGTSRDFARYFHRRSQ